MPLLIYCLNKADTHLAPGGNWSPETNEMLSKATNCQPEQELSGRSRWERHG